MSTLVANQFYSTPLWQVSKDEPVARVRDVRDPAHHPLAARQQDGHPHTQEGHRQQELVRGRPSEVWYQPKINSVVSLYFSSR